MTAHKDRKGLVRARAQRTGESYTTALQHLRSAQAEPGDAPSDARVPREARSVLRRYQDLLDDQLPGRIDGLYLVGAAALGEFDPRSDRLDFIAASGTPLSADDRTAGNVIHQIVQAEFPDAPLDGFYVTWDQLRTPPPRDSQAITAWKDGRLAPADIAGYPVSKVNPVTWTILARHGIALRGPEPGDIGISQDRAELTAWTLRNLDTYWRHTARTARGMPAGATAAFDARKLPWMILGPSRLHYTISTGHIITKDAGGQYALATLPDRWHGLIRDALAIHRNEAQTFSCATDDRLHVTFADFIDYVISDAHEIAGH